MRKQYSAVVTVLLFALAVTIIPAPTAHALPDREMYYTVRYACIVSPDAYGMIVGEWTLTCTGQMSGWGWQPGHNCTYTETEEGPECDIIIDPPLDP